MTAVTDRKTCEIRTDGTQFDFIAALLSPAKTIDVSVRERGGEESVDRKFRVRGIVLIDGASSPLTRNNSDTYIVICMDEEHGTCYIPVHCSNMRRGELENELIYCDLDYLKEHLEVTVTP